MKPIFPFSLIAMIVLMTLLPTLAQDDLPIALPDGCDPAAPTAAIDAYVEALAGDDITAITDTLRNLTTITRITHIACSGFRFSSEESGLQTVLGPIAFSSGIWVAEVTTSRAFIANISVVSGACDPPFNLFNVLSRTATNGASAVLETTDCVLLLEISNTREPWTLTFEQILVADEIPPAQPTPRPEVTAEATDEAE